MSTEKLIDKIRKLLAKANGTDIQAEADTFIAHANKLMLEHNLNMTDMDIEEDDDNAITGVRDYAEFNSTSWEKDLLNVVATHNFCKLVSTRTARNSKTVSMTIVGSVSSIEMTTYTYNAARGSMIRISNLRWKERITDGYSSHGKKVWMNSYLAGAVSGLNERFVKDREDARKANESGYGLMVIKNNNGVYLHMNMMFDNLRTSKQTRSRNMNWGAYDKGTADGRSLSISKAVSQSRNPDQKSIG